MEKETNPPLIRSEEILPEKQKWGYNQSGDQVGGRWIQGGSLSLQKKMKCYTLILDPHDRILLAAVWPLKIDGLVKSRLS
jgi:hypothetical protein